MQDVQLGFQLASGDKAMRQLSREGARLPSHAPVAAIMQQHAREVCICLSPGVVIGPRISVKIQASASPPRMSQNTARDLQASRVILAIAKAPSRSAIGRQTPASPCPHLRTRYRLHWLLDRTAKTSFQPLSGLSSTVDDRPRLSIERRDPPRSVLRYESTLCCSFGMV
jgi:hypothetical protein